MVNAVLLGSGGVIPNEERPLASLFLHFGQHTILVDCGEGTQIAAQRLGARLFKLTVVCITHLHADHVLGLPGILLTMMNESRTKPLLIVGPVGTQKYLQGFLAGVTHLSFPVYYCELEDASCSVDVGGVTIEAFSLQHNCVCFGYNIILERAGRLDVTTAQNLRLPEFTWGLLQNKMNVEVDGKEYSRFDLMGDDRNLKVSYVTDTSYFEGLANCVREADLLVMEGMYTDASSAPEGKLEVHMTMLEAAKIAQEAGVKLLCLTHFSPGLFNVYANAQEVQKIFKNTVWGFSGLRIYLDPNGDFQPLEEGTRVEVSLRSFKSLLFGKRSYVFLDSSSYYRVGEILCVWCHYNQMHFSFTGEITDIIQTDGAKIVSFRLIMVQGG